jgi:hypothetical protein
MATLSRALLFLMGISLYAFGELPSDLPGEEVTQDYMKWVLPKDTTPPVTNPGQPLITTWYDKVAKTWDAPAIAEQMASDRSHIPLGKGGIFIPRFSEFHRSPDIEIINQEGEVMASGEIGKTYSVVPGTYFVILGSGSHRQRIVRQVIVEESKATPVIPDWCGLTIETVDTNSISFRGEYELVRIDEFEPYGRGFGADPAVGEALTTWLLKPGTYKIFGRGQSFNTLRNFVTVRLLPGEYVKFLLVQRPDDYTIVGGGTVDLTPGTVIKSQWRYGASVGGSLNFISDIDKEEDENNKLNLNLDFRSGFWLSFNKAPFEWLSTLSLEEGFNVSDLDFFTKFDFDELASASDELRLTSLFIWRFLNWFGPYGRTEMSTNLFPQRYKRDDTKYKVFYMMESKSISSADIWDSSATIKRSNSFSPLYFEVGAGANFDVVRMRAFETMLRIGVGSSISNHPLRYENISIDKVVFPSDDSLFLQQLRSAFILSKEERTITSEFGPQCAINTSLHIGRYAIASAQFKVFTPVLPENRLTRPDFDLMTSLSWRLSRYVTLDYDYKYIIKQPEETTARENASTHRIWLRFSYSNK